MNRTERACATGLTHTAASRAQPAQALLEDTPAKGEARCPPLASGGQTRTASPAALQEAPRNGRGENFRASPKYGQGRAGPHFPDPLLGEGTVSPLTICSQRGPGASAQASQAPSRSWGGWQRLSSCWASWAGPLGRQWCFLEGPPRQGGHTASHGPQGHPGQAGYEGSAGHQGPQAVPHTLQAALQLVPQAEDTACGVSKWRLERAVRRPVSGLLERFFRASPAAASHTPTPPNLPPAP